MILPDVTILLAAFREDRFGPHRMWLEDVMNASDVFGVSPQVLSTLVSIATSKRIFQDPVAPEEAFAFTNVILSRPNCHLVQPGPRHWAIYKQLCFSTQARGDVSQDAWFAALAIEWGCDWITTDTDFGRFGGLRWRKPF